MQWYNIEYINNQTKTEGIVYNIHDNPYRKRMIKK